MTGGRGSSRVVVLSLDGFSTSVLDDSPVLRELATVSRSLWDNGFTGQPTLTYASHASLLTGAYLDRHGVPMNDAYADGLVVNTARGYLRAPTVFAAARAHGLVARAVLGDQHLARLLLTEDPAAPVWPQGGTYPAEVETDGIGDTFDRHVVEETLRVLAADDPDLLFVHLNDTDTAGHVATPTGDLAREWRARTDRELARLVGALAASPRWPQTTLLVVSDHDMLAVDTEAPILLQHALEGAHIGGATVVDEGGVAGVWLADLSAAADVVAVARSLAGVEDAVVSGPTTRPLMGEVVVMADATHAFARDEGGFRTPGVHGQPAASRTLAVVAGGDERLRSTAAATRLPADEWPRVVDWAPTAAALLGIAPPARCAGRVLVEAFADGALDA